VRGIWGVFQCGGDDVACTRLVKYRYGNDDYPHTLAGNNRT
jgi:hypothetical protein